MNEIRRARVSFYLLFVLPVVIALGYFVVMEHWQHMVEVAPYLILLLCPLMHIFMHGSHGGGSHRRDAGNGPLR